MPLMQANIFNGPPFGPFIRPLNNYFSAYYKQVSFDSRAVETQKMDQVLSQLAPVPLQNKITAVDCLLFATKLGWQPLMQYYIRKYGADLFQADNRGATVLHVAAYYGHFSIIEWRLSDINDQSAIALDHAHMTPYDYARCTQFDNPIGFHPGKQRMILNLLLARSEHIRDTASGPAQTNSSPHPYSMPPIASSLNGVHNGAFSSNASAISGATPNIKSNPEYVPITLEAVIDELYRELGIPKNPANPPASTPALRRSSSAPVSSFPAAGSSFPASISSFPLPAATQPSQQNSPLTTSDNHEPGSIIPVEENPGTINTPEASASLPMPRGGIHHKYTGVPKIKLPEPTSAASAPAIQTHIKFELTALKEIAVEYSLNLSNQVIDTAYLKGEYYSHRGLPQPQDKVTLIMAGRGMNALVPMSDNQLTVLVMPRAQFQTIKEECLSRLTETMACFVIDEITQPWMDAPVNSDDLRLITSRRIATFLFALQCDLENFLMLDDNIEQFIFGQNSTSDNLWNHLYDLLTEQCVQIPITSVSTKSNLKKMFNPHALGSKCFMVNLGLLISHGLDLEAIFSLFPEFMDAWGEDYYWQTAVQLLINRQGFQTVAPEMVALARSRNLINAAKNSVKVARELTPSETYKDYLNRNGLDWVLKAIEVFNSNVKENITGQKAALAKRLDANLFNLHARANGIPNTPTPAQDHVIPGPLNQEHLSALLKNMLQMPSAHQPDARFLRKHQREAISFFIKNLPDLLNAESGVNQLQFNIATGCGKSLILIALAMAIYSTPRANKVFIITPQQDLVEQLYQSFKEAIENFPQLSALKCPLARVLKIAGMDKAVQARTIAKSEFSAGIPAIVICCAASANILLEQNPDFVLQITFVIADESHLCRSSVDALRAASLTTPVIKFSATPSAQPKVRTFSYKTAQAVNDGVIAPFILDQIILPDNTPDPVNTLLRYLPALIKHQIHPSANDDKQPQTLGQLKGIIFFESQSQAEEALKILANYFKVYLITSNNPKRERDLEDFKASDMPAIALAVNMLQLGFDDPRIHWFMDLHPGQRTDVKAQKTGRVLRKFERKTGYGLLLNPENYESLFMQGNSQQWPLCLEYLGGELLYKDEEGVINVYDPPVSKPDTRYPDYVYIKQSRTCKPNSPSLTDEADAMSVSDDEADTDMDVDAATPATSGFFNPGNSRKRPAADEADEPLHRPKRR